jgi:hypothetical protein
MTVPEVILTLPTKRNRKWQRSRSLPPRVAAAADTAGAHRGETGRDRITVPPRAAAIRRESNGSGRGASDSDERREQQRSGVVPGRPGVRRSRPHARRLVASASAHLSPRAAARPRSGGAAEAAGGLPLCRTRHHALTLLPFARLTARVFFASRPSPSALIAAGCPSRCSLLVP